MFDMNEDNKIRLTGVLVQGYGIIPKAVMKDRNISRDAKSIYSYLCSYAGKGNSSFPSTKLMMYDLCFSDWRTFKKHLDMLLENEYIYIEKSRKEGKFDNNVYIINLGKNVNKQDDCPDCNNSSKEKFHTGKIPVRKNSSTNNNNLLKITKNNNNNNVDCILSWFEETWLSYPRKEGKNRITGSKKRLKELYKSKEEVEKAVKGYNNYIQLNKIEKQYIKKGSTFFGNDDYMDYIQYAEENKKIKPKYNFVN